MHTLKLTQKNVFSIYFFCGFICMPGNHVFLSHFFPTTDDLLQNFHEILKLKRSYSNFFLLWLLQRLIYRLESCNNFHCCVCTDSHFIRFYFFFDFPTMSRAANLILSSFRHTACVLLKNICEVLFSMTYNFHYKFTVHPMKCLLGKTP